MSNSSYMWHPLNCQLVVLLGFLMLSGMQKKHHNILTYTRSLTRFLVMDLHHPLIHSGCPGYPWLPVPSDQMHVERGLQLGPDYRGVTVTTEVS